MPCKHVKLAKEHCQANLKEANAFKVQPCTTESVVYSAQVAFGCHTEWLHAVPKHNSVLAVNNANQNIQDTEDWVLVYE